MEEDWEVYEWTFDYNDTRKAKLYIDFFAKIVSSRSLENESYLDDAAAIDHE